MKKFYEKHETLCIVGGIALTLFLTLFTLFTAADLYDKAHPEEFAAREVEQVEFSEEELEARRAAQREAMQNYARWYYFNHHVLSW